MSTARLPVPGADGDTWGDLLNEYLAVEHNPDGTLRDVVRTADLRVGMATDFDGAAAQPGQLLAVTAVDGGEATGFGLAPQVTRLVASPGDGTTDVTGAFQEAIDAVAASGGGAVVFGPGVHRVAGLTLRSRVHLRGPGHAAGVLQLVDGADTDVIVGEGFAALTGHDDPGGIHSFSLSQFSVDGNRAHNSAGAGIRVYGRDFVLRDLRVYSCAGDGVHTEWADISSLPGVNDAMESYAVDVKSHDNGGYGFNVQGPHDGFWQECVAYHNDGGYGFRIHGNAHGSLFRSCHSWGRHRVAVSIEQNGSQWEDGDAETDVVGGACLWVAANDVRVSGKVWSPGEQRVPGVYGLRIGDVDRPVLNLHANVTITGTTAGGIDFVNSGGLNWISAHTWLTAGSVLTGTAHPDDVLDLPSPGGVRPDWHGRGGGSLVRDWTAANYLRHRTMLPNPGGSAGWYRLGTWRASAEGSRLLLEVTGTSGYGGTAEEVGRTTVVASLANGVSPNVVGYFFSEGGKSAVYSVKAVPVGSATGWAWAIWAAVDAYTGNSHVKVETGTDAFPATWEWDLAPGDDPSAWSATVAHFARRQVVNGLGIAFGAHLVPGLPAGHSVSLAAHPDAGVGARVVAQGTCADTAGTLEVTAGSGATAGGLARVTFAVPYDAVPKAVVVTAGDAAGATLLPYVPSVSATGFTVGAADAPADGRAYVLRYVVIG